MNICFHSRISKAFITFIDIENKIADYCMGEIAIILTYTLRLWCVQTKSLKPGVSCKQNVQQKHTRLVRVDDNRGTQRQTGSDVTDNSQVRSDVTMGGRFTS